MALQTSVTFKKSDRLTTWVRFILYVHLAITVIALISGLLEYNLLVSFKNGAYASQAEAVAAAEANDARQRIIGIALFIVFWVTGISFLTWIYRANSNARQLGASEMRFTPGWSIGWYFIPVANLWKPYQAMKEIWRASKSPQDLKSQATPPLLNWWWMLWIASSVLGNVSFRMSMRAKQLDELITSDIVTLLSDAFDIPLILTVLILVGQIHKMQISHYNHCPEPN